MTTVVLSKPIAFGPAIYNELTFRKIAFGDMPAVIKAASLVDLDDIVRLVANLADIPLEAACAVDLDDIEAVLTALTDHITASAQKH